MALLDDAVAAELRQAFQALSRPVRLVVFPGGETEPELGEVAALVEELAALDPRLTAERRDLVADETRARELGVERAPAIAVLGAEKDHGIRFYGLPGGYEFGALVAAVLDVSRGDSGLSPSTRQGLARLEADVHLRVFSTPT